VAVLSQLQISSYIEQMFDRLRRIEQQLAVLSEQAGVPYDNPAAGAAPEVLELVEAGDRMGAIRKYRELTGADLDEARAAVEAL